MKPETKVALIGAAATIIAAIIGGVFLLQSVGTPQSTPTPSSASTSISTLTPRSTSSLTPGPYGIPVGQLLLDDQLVTNTKINTNQRWQEGESDNNGSCRFRTGGYVVSATDYHTSCQDTSDVFANFVLQVDMQLSSRSQGRIQFRVPPTGGGYYFGIDDLGNYEIGKNNPTPPIKQVLHQNSPKNTYNLIVVADGSSFTLYIDGKRLDQFTDTSYTDGHIALAADGVAPPNTQPNTEVLFTNLKVWQR